MKNKGIIPINKPKGWTSFDAVNKLKYKLKPLKVGHLGTLDPMATGVLLVTVGKATKLFDIMQEKEKTYVATFEFGYLTDTLDADGVELKKTNNIPTREDILKVLPKFIGNINQVPPKYSAKSIKGERAYNLARNGVEFELPAKEVEVIDLKLISYDMGILKLEVVCGSGTYIRAIGRDIATELNSLATMTELVRTKVGNFELHKCLDIVSLVEVKDSIIPIKEILAYSDLKLDEIQTSKLLNGQTIFVDCLDGTYLVSDEFDVIAIVQVKENKAKMSLFLG